MTPSATEARHRSACPPSSSSSSCATRPGGSARACPRSPRRPTPGWPSWPSTTARPTGRASCWRKALGERRVVTLAEDAGAAGALRAAYALPVADEADFLLVLHDDAALDPDGVDTAGGGRRDPGRRSGRDRGRQGRRLGRSARAPRRRALRRSLRAPLLAAAGRGDRPGAVRPRARGAVSSRRRDAGLARRLAADRGLRRAVRGSARRPRLLLAGPHRRVPRADDAARPRAPPCGRSPSTRRAPSGTARATRRTAPRSPRC